ncbi:unnamed protein product [Anisakis simplex]|uniref:DNA polymerase epsilon catalytic subunit n=1 Tax=Anisakis simplex TaxID=6269 RepID=A0A0M3KDB2_ANISI|nr:unnamed protein product [Anisakis simplex]
MYSAGRSKRSHMNALVHNARIADAEGGSGSTGFLSSVSLSGDVLCGKVKTIAQYDEAASVSGAMKVLRSMVQECAKDIHLSSNAIADQLIVNIYRWIHSPRALLYEPAIARAVDILVTKLCLLLVAEITRMGGEVLHASQTRMIICTKRANKQLATAFITSMISTLKQNPLFAALYISPIHFWNILLWMDIENYACIEFADVGDEENGKEDRITSKLSIADLLPEEAMCKSTFSRILLEYMQTIATKMKSEVSGEELVAYREDLIRNEISERLFAIFSKLAIYKKDVAMPDRTASRETLHDAPLQLAKCIIHFLSFDEKVAQTVDKVSL